MTPWQRRVGVWSSLKSVKTGDSALIFICILLWSWLTSLSPSSLSMPSPLSSPAKIILVWFVRCCQPCVRILSALHPYYRKLCENWKLANIASVGTPAGKWSLKTYHISSEHDANMMDAHETPHTKHISPARYLSCRAPTNNVDPEHQSQCLRGQNDVRFPTSPCLQSVPSSWPILDTNDIVYPQVWRLQMLMWPAKSIQILKSMTINCVCTTVSSGF